jgi:amino acid transporter
MRRSLGPFDVICIGLNAIVGSGIFLLPDDLYRQMGWLSPLAFLLCALGLLPVALCYAEAAGRVNATGGPYVYATEAFGAKTGFAVGWMCFANSMFSFAAVSSAAAASLGYLVPALSGAWALKAVALSIIVVFGTLNYLGAKPGAVAVDLFTIAKFAVLLLLLAALLPEVEPSRAAGALPGFGGVGAAVFMALFAAQGFEVVPVPAGETRAPEKTVPRAIVGSLLAASLLYVAVQSVLVLAADGLAKESDTPLTAAALAVAPGLGMVVAIGGLISTLGFVSGSALGTPRYLFAAASDRHLPIWFAAVHPRFSSPHRAVLATAALACVFVLPFDYRSLIGMSNVSVAVQYLATCLAVLKLRRASADEATRKRAPWLPLLGALLSLWIFTEASRVELGWAFAALVVGLLLSVLSQRTARKPAHS